MGRKAQGELFPDTDSELAPGGASRDSIEIEKLKNKFAELDDQANRKAKNLRYAGKAHENAWADLIPVLDKMQSLFSERGRDHAKWKRAGLPSWTEWWKKFQEVNDFDACLRRVQKKLKEYRDRQRLLEEGASKEEQAIPSEEIARFKMLHGALSKGEKSGTKLSETLVKFILRRFSDEEVQEFLDRLKQEFSRKARPPVRIRTPEQTPKIGGK